VRTRSAGESRTIGDPELTPADRAALLALARSAIDAALGGRDAPPVPAVPAAALRRGAFVTLEEGAALRGCIGRVTADGPLGEVIRTVAVSAARDDPRFPPVEAGELSDLRIEISVLSLPVRVDPVDPGRVAVGRDGLLVRRGAAVGVLLPQVATELHLDASGFLAVACRKAGLAPGAWREPDVQVSTFQADVFGE
jgi:AmmeMemoRadiSam system protein A